MQVSSQTNPYANMQALQQPINLPVKPDVQSTLPVVPENPIRPDIPVKPELPTDGENSQVMSDEARQTLVAYAGHESKKTQAEIYLSVALDSKVNLDNGSKVMIEALRETQQQNNAIKAYSAYQENQQMMYA